MEQEVAELFIQKNLKVTTAESCTGGLIAAALVNVSGISGQFEEGYITYSTAAKEKILGVRHQTLEQNGAVSSQTAEEMARGAKRAANADVSIISTGIAGPDGGTKEKPVGLVYLACCYQDIVNVKRCQFSGGRQEVRRAAVEEALKLAKETIQQ